MAAVRVPNPKTTDSPLREIASAARGEERRWGYFVCIHVCIAGRRPKCHRHKIKMASPGRGREEGAVLLIVREGATLYMDVAAQFPNCEGPGNRERPVSG